MASGTECVTRPIFSGSGTATTNNKGFFQIDFGIDNPVILINVWCPTADVLIPFFSGSNATIAGQRFWWGKALNANTMEAIASMEIQYYYIYTK